MTEMYQWFSVYMPFLAPPLIGALIGYLTNKIAIRMLFRPLRPWRFFRWRVPMTPGVIPSKRHLLAINIGKMVGTHLLTGREVGRALTKPSFRLHLAELVESRISALFNKELPPLPELIPKKYYQYFTIGVKTIAYQIRQQIHGAIHSRKFETRLTELVQETTAELMGRDVDSLIDRSGREAAYTVLRVQMKKLLNDVSLVGWIEDLLYAEIHSALKNGSSLRQILPDSLTQATLAAVRDKIPELLEKLATISEDPQIQERVAEAIKKAVEKFSSSLGPMGTMVQSFLSAEKIEKSVKEYLENNREEIREWLGSDEVRGRVTTIVLERLEHYLDMPVSAFVSDHSRENIRKICSQIARQIAAVLQQEGLSDTLSAFIAEHFELTIESGGRELGTFLNDIFGESSKEELGRRASGAVLSFLRSRQTRRFIDVTVNTMLASLLRRPVGKLANILPAGVRKGVYTQVHSMSTAMLATEVPGLVGSLNIEQIVAEKVDSLDLLRLEELLLSIMEEQFKYINLFGALLGFLIGALNVALLLLL